VGDFDDAGDVLSPRTVTFEGDDSSFFTLTIKSARYTSLIDSAIDDTESISVDIDLAAGALSVTYVDKLLTITAQATTTVSALRAAIVAVTATLTDFEVSAVSGAGTGDAITAVDQDSTNVATGAAIELMPDVWRTVMYANQYVFKTANGFSRYGDLLRDVKLGDKLTWTVTPASTGVEETGSATIVDLEADYSMPSAIGPTVGSYNQATVNGDELDSTALTVTPGADNQRNFDGPNTRQNALDAAVLYGIGSLSKGVFTDTYTVTITTSGPKGTARATVSNSSGTYSRDNVLIENVGTDDGKIYLGNNITLNMDQGAGDVDAVFKAGDTYEITVSMPYVAVDDITLSGIYAGTKNTTYQVKVVTGGLFERTVVSAKGLSTPTDDCTVEPDITNWSAGDVDDEYVLECTTGGSIAAARFRLTSQRGELVSNIAFSGFGSGNSRSLGISGLRLYLDYSIGIPTFVVGNYWSVIVKASRPWVRISDSAGVDQSGTVLVVDGELILLGVNGLKVTIPDNVNNLAISAKGGLVKNDTFTVVATASAAAEVHTIVLDSMLSANVATGLDADGNAPTAPDLIAMDLMLVRNGVEVPKENRDPGATPGEYNWQPSTSNVVVATDITMQDSEWVNDTGIQPFLPVEAGTMYLQYRALLTDYSGSIFSLSDPSEVEDTLGPVVADNPLAQSAYFALLNSGGVEVRFSAVTTNDSAGYGRVLELIERVNTVYGITPATMDPAIVTLVQAHVNAMSTPTCKRWRRGFFGVEAADDSAVIDADTNPDMEDWLATITEDERTLAAPITKVEFTGNPGLLSKAHAGDTVRFSYSTDAWGNVAYLTGTVAEIETNNVLYLETGLDAPVAIAEKTEVWHTNSVADKSVILAAKCAMGDRRNTACPIWFTALGELQTAQVGAACAAGLRSSVVPQQGLTNTEVLGPESIPATYSLFTPTQIDSMAESGAYIIMQELKDGSVFVMHQLTTARSVTTDWRYAEETGTTNADSISYYFTESLAPFIGRYNLTPELIEAIRTQFQSGLNYLGSFTAVGLLGPQVDLSTSQIAFIGRDPVAADRLRLRAEIGQFAPLNNIDLDLIF